MSRTPIQIALAVALLLGTAAPAFADGADAYPASPVNVGGVSLRGMTVANGSEGEPQPLNSFSSLPETGGHWSVRQAHGQVPGNGYGQLPN